VLVRFIEVWSSRSELEIVAEVEKALISSQ
jgi:hypothetical protein